MKTESEIKLMLKKKLNRSLGRLKPVVFSIEEAEQLLHTMDDLSKRNIALEQENTALSLFNYQRSL